VNRLCYKRMSVTVNVYPPARYAVHHALAVCQLQINAFRSPDHQWWRSGFHLRKRSPNGGGYANHLRLTSIKLAKQVSNTDCNVSRVTRRCGSISAITGTPA